MLPEYYYEQACQLFYKLLHRVEALEHGENCNNGESNTHDHNFFLKKLPCCPPAIPPELQLKWGLTLLGEEKARQYLEWMQTKLDSSAQ